MTIRVDYHSLTPVFNVKGADEFIAFCKAALGAEELTRRPAPNGAVIHVDLRIGDTVVMVSDAIKEAPTSSAMAYWVSDCDKTFEAALCAGAAAVFSPTDMPWGRWARVTDKWGNSWTFNKRA
jgi:PhnB protein